MDAPAPLFQNLHASASPHPPRFTPPPVPATPPQQTPRTRPALSVCNLGSGSGGNCTALRLSAPHHPDAAVLIDLGFGPRTTAHRLAQASLAPGDVAAALLTHLDRDHYKPHWADTLLALRIPVHCDRWHADELLATPGGPALHRANLIRPFDAGSPFTLHTAPGRTLRVATHRCQHDRQGTVAFRLDDPAAHAAVAHATDLGHVPPPLIRLFAGVGLLSIEANYDEHMTIHSARPSFVNRRNLSDSGHLSNEQAFDAVAAIAARCPAGGPARVLLLHRSSQCNHPTKLRRVFAQDPRLARRTTLTDPRRRTRWFTVQTRRAVLTHQLPLCVA